MSQTAIISRQARLRPHLPLGLGPDGTSEELQNPPGPFGAKPVVYLLQATRRRQTPCPAGPSAMSVSTNVGGASLLYRASKVAAVVLLDGEPGMYDWTLGEFVRTLTCLGYRLVVFFRPPDGDPLSPSSKHDHHKP